MKTLIYIFLFCFILTLSNSAQQTEIRRDSLKIDSLKRDTIILDSLQKDSILADSIFSKNVRKVIGKASYYASKFHGRRTSSGEIYSNNKMTAAHLRLPFGTLVKVKNVVNGRSVIVKVNDRGPHTKAFIIDVSQAAAKKLGFYGKGVANVVISYKIPEK
ncbi:septal ring lytic transglycosylase RlpA family protein [Daejeonella sp.]|uniref:septal ring lytic transglycosylase RlpA family protein n=1 Tax=Daejeonella sp. TaxID=2805397 RepID=UPI003783150F